MSSHVKFQPRWRPCPRYPTLTVCTQTAADRFARRRGGLATPLGAAELFQRGRPAAEVPTRHRSRRCSFVWHGCGPVVKG